MAVDSEAPDDVDNSLPDLAPPRRGPDLEHWDLPGLMQISLARGLDQNLQQVQAAADRRGSIQVMASKRSGRRRLYDIRDALPEGYTATVRDNDPERHPEDYKADRHFMWVTRDDGKTSISGVGNPQEAAIRSHAYWQAKNREARSAEDPKHPQDTPPS